ncbi:hypothetical protein [Rhodanobacter sp. DHG33]|uniref:hypothetical protein n=1 Tax=Rhodanobacter sp. DHG33 TaxID=2775921 RepID=UPI00177B9480|nr:hypothetical protein [Rhodanobacter sp. DHG33]MBD8900591.1 hypothetical protein [Rhodanobacter sp. DHG33]
MVNPEVENVISKLRGCRILFYVTSALGFLLAICMSSFLLACVRENAIRLAGMNAAGAVGFLWCIHIFIREDRVLSGVVVEAGELNETLILTTIFSKKVSLRRPTVVALGPEWLRKRRVWPFYFLSGVNAIQYARQPSKIVQALKIEGVDGCFYWIYTDPTKIPEFLRGAKEGGAPGSIA